MLRLFKKTATDLEEFDLLEGSLSIPLTQAQTNPTNPTKYTTEYSKTVKLPLTPKNLQMMGYYTELDSIISNITFKPTVAMPVVVVNDNDIIFEGKLKLDKVNDYKGNHTMECTLYGMMNDYFNKMLNTSYWYDSVDQTRAGVPVNSAGMFVLPNLLDVDYNICKETVLESWRTLPNGVTATSPFHQATLNPVRTTTGYNPVTSQSHSVIAWAPTEQGYYANFEKEKVIIGGVESVTSGSHAGEYTIDICYGGTQNGTLVDVFGEKGEDYVITTNPRVKEPCYIPIDKDQKALADVIMGEGFSERQWCQYRSYYQKPTVYVNQLWKQYQELSEEITGMPLELDTDWFNNTNTRYTDLVYTLPDLQQEKKSESGGDTSNPISFSNVSIDCHDYAFGTNGGGNATVTLTSQSAAISNGHVIVGPNNTGYCNFKLQVGIYLRRRGGLSNSSEYALCNGDGTASCIDLQVAFRNVNNSNDVSTYNFKIVDENNTSWSASSVDQLIRMGTKSWNPDPQTIYFTLEGEVLIGQNNSNSNKEYEMICSVYCYNGNIDGGPGKALFQTRGRVQNDTALCASCGDNPIFTFSNLQTSVTVSQEYRSNFKLEMKDLFPANYSPFNILLQYTKLFNLVWDYDQLRNKVTVMTREKWFSKYMNDVLDWTDKVDKSREFFFKPLAWDKKYVLFNYNDFEMDWLKPFKERYGLTYGTKRITTQYNFNTESEELMCTNDSDKINPSLQVSMSRFPMSSVAATDPSPMRYYETFIGNRKDSKAANIWGQFFFRNGVKDWDADGSKNNVYTNCTSTGSIANTAFRNFGINLVDDTRFQIRRKIFAVDMTIYASAQDRKLQVPSNTRPIFSVFDRNGSYGCQFSKPAMTFYDPDAPEMQKTIQLLWWTTNLGPVENWAADAYTDRWDSIIAEQYNEQNKLITCYVKLSDVDFRRLTCNRFVKIGNVLYVIYKVEDFQLGVGGLTKVTLLQVWDIRKYLKEYYVEPEPVEPPTVDPVHTPFYIENITENAETITIGPSSWSSSTPNVTVEQSFDNQNWSMLGNTSSSSFSFTLQPNTRIYLRATSTSDAWGASLQSRACKILGCSKVGGNIMSLLYGGAFTGNETEYPNVAAGTTVYRFAHLFRGNTTLQSAGDLIMPANTIERYSHEHMFRDCSSLTSVPVLPAASLSASGCYQHMFDGCSLVNHIVCLATTVPTDNNCTLEWVNGVASSGTFQTAPGMTYGWTRGISGIPNNWLVIGDD